MEIKRGRSDFLIKLLICFITIVFYLKPSALHAQGQTKQSEVAHIAPQWVEFLNSELERSSKDAVIYALLTTAGWVNMGQIYWHGYTKGTKGKLTRVLPGVSLSNFKKSRSQGKADNHKVLENVDLLDLKSLTGLLEEKSQYSKGLDHVKFQLLHLEKKKGAIHAKTVVFDSPELEKQCQSCVDQLDTFFKWVVKETKK